MDEGLKLISVNIEGDRHFDTVLPFLERERPDVVCLQEVYVDQLARFSNYPHQKFLRQAKRPRHFGVALLSRLPFVHSWSKYYWEQQDPDEIFVFATLEERRRTYSQGYVAGDIEKNGGHYRILTNYFTWTPDGQPNDYQRADMKNLRALLAAEGEHVLCGDFNIPRERNELSRDLAQGYTDAIPNSYRTSIDVPKHKARGNPAAVEQLSQSMVDYLLTTPAYTATDVRLQDGVSDHMAIVATLHRR